MARQEMTLGKPDFCVFDGIGHCIEKFWGKSFWGHYITFM